MIAPSKKKEHTRMWIFQFQVSDTIFGLEVEDTKEVVHMAELIIPPGLPSFLSGFVNIEGQAIPVVALSILMGFPEQSIEMYTPLVIMGKEQTIAALIVEKVLKVEPIEGNQLYPLDDESIFNQCVSKSGKNSDGDVFYLLSPERILLAQEQQMMTEFQAMAQKRLDALQTEDAVDG